MSQSDYDYLCDFLKERSGLALAPDKEYLVDNRLLPVARRHGRKTVAELIQMLKGPDSGHLKVEVTEAMMNNESYFFRDRVPFDRLGDTVLPDLLRTRALRKKIRIWCAAASTGQEPYSIAMQLDQRAELGGWRVEIAATDISGDAIERAKAGLYSQFEVQRGLPIQMLMQHFEEVAGQWRIVERLRNRVDFQTINLLTDFSRLGQFDVVFLRNVLIYFDRDTKLDVLARVRESLAPDGYLLLGAAETMVGLGDLFKMVPETRALYRPNVAPKKPELALVPGGARVA
ncbi:MAG TPA: CheR family methyltransferase [Xanthobacteraceae bacterium]|nr:CheR family methyltransferase [Xanthobacteraceae bacterium]